jgi:transcriptional regulator with XRE-family HTH domain
MDTGETAGSETYEDLPAEHVIIDQIVAANIRHWRRAAGMTQEELGERIGWSAANVSAAERSADSDRDRRRFDAHTLVTLAVALGVPLIAFFLPPLGDGAGMRYTFQPGEHDAGSLDMVDLMARAVMPDSDNDSPAMNAYRQRLRSAVVTYLDGSWAEEVARWLGEADSKEVRADRVEQLRQRSNEMLQAAAEFERLADSIAGLDDKP